MNKGFIFGGDSFVWGEGLDLIVLKLKISFKQKIHLMMGQPKFQKNLSNFKKKIDSQHLLQTTLIPFHRFLIEMVVIIILV
jgi:hypothetical protein